MIDHAIRTLEFDSIIMKLVGYAVSKEARGQLSELKPILNPDLLGVALNETSDAKDLIERFGQPPLAMMENLDESITLAAAGAMLVPEQLSGVATFANTCRRLQLYLKKGEDVKIELSLHGRALVDLTDVQYMIEDAIRGDVVSDQASPYLRDIRRRIAVSEEQVKRKLASLLQGHKEWFSDGFVAIRSGRSTLPVKAQYRQQVPGTIVDRSHTGGTLFIEPQAVRQAQDELEAQRFEEENEIRRVLYELTALVADCEGAIRSNMRAMRRLDFAFAKALLSLEMGARRVPVEEGAELRIVSGRHPLIPVDSVVPLNFHMDDGVRGVVITGPNTGGKTVALKTIGLLSMMAQSGLHVPVQKGTSFPMHNLTLVDIGDGQNIAENLSTFSAHMTRALSILQSATAGSLVLMDELGSGTDPAEGMGLAVAIMQELVERGCLFVVTTHYPEVKEFATGEPAVNNARMTFDPATFEPLYQLVLNESGESCALMIARRLGFPADLIERARRAAYDSELHSRGTMRTESRAPSVKGYVKPVTAPPKALSFKRGDSVRVYPGGITAIVYQESDDMGMIHVQTHLGKLKVLYKRLKLIAPASEMYPEDYDFSIVFDTVANRKARHQIERKHDSSAVVVLEDGADKK